MKRETGQYPNHQVRAEAILGQLGRLESAQDHEQIQTERDQDAHKAVFLGQTGEHEVVVRFGQESVPARLSGAAKPLAEQSARSHRDPGLQLLIAFALGIEFGIEERLDTAPLVVGQGELVRGPGQHERDQRDDAEPLHAHAADKGHAEKHRHERQRRTEVGLAQDQDHRQREKQPTDGDFTHRPAQALRPGKIRRQDQRNSDTGELARLKIAERTDDHPPPRPVAHDAEERDVDQQGDQRTVDDQGPLRQGAVVEQQTHHEHEEADAHGIELPPELAPGRLVHEIPLRAVDRRQPDRHQRDHRGHEGPIEMRQDAAVDDHLPPPPRAPRAAPADKSAVPVPRRAASGGEAGVPISTGGGGGKTGNGLPSCFAKKVSST